MSNSFVLLSHIPQGSTQWLFRISILALIILSRHCSKLYIMSVSWSLVVPEHYKTIHTLRKLKEGSWAVSSHHGGRGAWHGRGPPMPRPCRPCFSSNNEVPWYLLPKGTLTVMLLNSNCFCISLYCEQTSVLYPLYSTAIALTLCHLSFSHLRFMCLRGR